MNTKHTKTLALAALSLMGIAGVRSASADIVFLTGTNPPTINVTFDNQPDSMLIKGSFIDSQAPFTKVNFQSDEMLTVPSTGQARVKAVDQEFDNLGIFLDPGFSFTKLEANPYMDLNETGTLDVIVTSSIGVSVFTYDISLGNNRFSVESFNGEVINRVDMVSSNTELHGLRHVRMILTSGGGNPPPPPAEVPEPGTLAMMVGVAVPGLGLYLRKRRAARA